MASAPDLSGKWTLYFSEGSSSGHFPVLWLCDERWGESSVPGSAGDQSSFLWLHDLQFWSVVSEKKQYLVKTG